MTKAVDCDLVMIRNTGSDIELWNATYAEACPKPTAIQLSEWGHVEFGSVCLFLAPIYPTTPDATQIRALFSAAGAALEIVPLEFIAKLDPLIFKFPCVQRWAGALVHTGFMGLSGTAIEARRNYVGLTRSEQLQINAGTRPLPRCWYSKIPTVMAYSVDLIDSIIAGEIGGDVATSEVIPVSEVALASNTKKVTAKSTVVEADLPDGRVGTDTFRIDGILMTDVPRVQMRFLEALVNANGKAVDTRDLTGPGNVWDDEFAADHNAVGGMRKRINKQFLLFRIKRHIATSDSYGKVQMKAGSPKKTGSSARKSSRPRRARKMPASRPQRARDI